MTEVVLQQQSVKSLRGKVVVITGTARGIGAATVSLLCKAGAKVVHGDWDSAGGQKVDADLLASSNDASEGEAYFVQTDVTDYESILKLFEIALEKYGKVDIAISNAGIQEIGNWYDPSLDLAGVRIRPSTKVIDVNLTGSLYFSRIAAVYLKQGPGSEEDKSLVLVSSTAGFKETPGLFIYQASKHGVLGLVRSLRLVLPKTHGIRVNTVCPWMTDTAMVDGIRETWLQEGLPVNSPEDIGKIMIELGCNQKWNGRAVFVEGGRGWDIEEGIDKTEPLWLGESVSKTLAKGQEVLGDGTDWDKPESKG